MVVIGVLIIGVIIFIFIRAKINIDWISFINPTLPLALGVFGVYCFTGKQGSGKTYSLVKFIQKHAKGKKIYSNLTFTGLDYTPIKSVKQLLDLKDERECYIIYDEIFTLMEKNTKFKAPMMEFLTQQRKMENIFITTAQEWLELPITFRRFVRIQIECRTRPLGRFGGILSEKYYNAYDMKWDQLENEYVAPLITQKYSKYEKRYMESYDTFERIRILENG